MNIEVLMDIDDELVKGALERLKKDETVTNVEPTARGLFTLAVDKWLPSLQGILLACRLVDNRMKRRRPRRIDSETWDQLGETAKELNVSQIALLRCVVDLYRTHGTDIDSFERDISKAFARKKKEKSTGSGRSATRRKS